MFIQPGGNKFKVLALSLFKETMGRFKLRSNMLPMIRGRYRKENRSVKFTDFDGGNKIALISVSNESVSITWNP